MLEAIFLSVLVSSVIGTVLSLLLTLFEPVTRRYFNPSWHYYMYVLVLVVMLAPVKIRVPEPQLNIEGNFNYPVEYQDLSTQTEILMGEENPVQIDEQAGIHIKTAADITKKQLSAVSVIWIVAAVIIFAVKLVKYRLFISGILKNSAETKPDVTDEYEVRRFSVRVSNKAHSPFMVGVFKPVLVLPEGELSHIQLKNILSHEITHLKRNDMLVKWLSVIVKSVHFFNPAVYGICSKLDKECEISCDALVVKNMTRAEEMDYVSTIISLISKSHDLTPAFTTGMSASKEFLKKRFELIKNKRNIGKKTIIISVVIAIILFAVSLLETGLINGRLNYMVSADNSPKVYTGYIDSADSDYIQVYTEKDGEFVMSIPWAVVEPFPANNINDENYKFGWMEHFDIYCGEIDDFRWAVVVSGVGMGATNTNVCTSNDNGKNWYVNNTDYMRKGIVDNAWFVSETEGYISYSGGGYGKGISKTTDGGRTWEHKMEYDMPLPLSADDAVLMLKYQLITAYEMRYGEYIPRYDDPGNMAGDKERLPYIIETLRITKDDGEYYTVPVIWDFLIEKETGKIYKLYDGLDKMLLLFDPYDENALSFAG